MPTWFFSALFSADYGILPAMELRERLLEVDARLVAPHRILNAIAMGKVVDTADVHAAIAEITRARDLLHDGAEAPPNN